MGRTRNYRYRPANCPGDGAPPHADNRRSQRSLQPHGKEPTRPAVQILRLTENLHQSLHHPRLPSLQIRKIPRNPDKVQLASSHERHVHLQLAVGTVWHAHARRNIYHHRRDHLSRDYDIDAKQQNHQFGHGLIRSQLIRQYELLL